MFKKGQSHKVQSVGSGIGGLTGDNLGVHLG